MVIKINPKGALGVFLEPAPPNLKDHQMRLSEVFRSYLKRPLTYLMNNQIKVDLSFDSFDIRGIQ